MTAPKLRIPRPDPAPDVAVGRQPDEPAMPGRGDGTRIWLVRHALVHEDWHGLAYGGLDIPLSADGERQTAALAAAFCSVELAEVTCSSLARAEAMGRRIAEAVGAPLRVDERLREIDRGAWQGIGYAEFRRRWESDPEFFRDPWAWRGHAGESDAQLFARAWPAFDDAARRAAGRTVAIAAHSNVIRVLLGRLTGTSAFESYALRIDPAHATLVADRPGGWTIERANVAAP